jgi:hypothetical protein
VERRKYPASEPRSIAGVPFGDIHARWIQTLFVAVELHIVTPESAAEEASSYVLA